MVKNKCFRYFTSYRVILSVGTLLFILMGVSSLCFFVQRYIKEHGFHISVVNYTFSFKDFSLELQGLSCFYQNYYASNVAIDKVRISIGHNYFAPYFRVDLKDVIINIDCNQKTEASAKRFFSKLDNGCIMSVLSNASIVFHYLGWLKISNCKLNFYSNNIYTVAVEGLYNSKKNKVLEKKLFSHELNLAVKIQENYKDLFDLNFSGACASLMSLTDSSCQGFINCKYLDSCYDVCVRKHFCHKEWLLQFVKDHKVIFNYLFTVENEALQLLDYCENSHRAIVLENLHSLKNILHDSKKQLFFGDRLIIKAQLDSFLKLLCDIDVSSKNDIFINKLAVHYCDNELCVMQNILNNGVPILRGQVDLSSLDCVLKKALNSDINDIVCKHWLLWLDQRSLRSGVWFGGQAINSNSNITKNKLKSFSGNIAYNVKDMRFLVKNLDLFFEQGVISCKKSFLDLTTYLYLLHCKADSFLLEQPNMVIRGHGSIFMEGSVLDRPLLKGELCCDKGFVLLDKFGVEYSNVIIPQVLSSSDEQIKSLCDIRLKVMNTDPVRVVVSGEELLVDLNLDIDGCLDYQCDLSKLKTRGQVLFKAEKFFCLGSQLDLVKGCFDFYDNALNDPLIRIDVWTKIKRYNLSFHIFGVLEDLMISTRSEPRLTEDQILSLCLTGIADRRQGMRHLIGTLLSRYGASWCIGKKIKPATFLKKIISPLPGLQVAPCVTELGGVTSPVAASVLIDLGDNLSASIEKDLNNRDDLRLNLEYLLSDNVLFKINRNYEGVLQGQMEMKFKF